jgi:flagellar hook-basal body complex protein FliE
MNVASLAQTAIQNLMNNQTQAFQNTAQNSLQNGQNSNSNNSFQTLLNSQLSSGQNNSLSQISASGTQGVSGVQAAGQADGTSMFTDIANGLTSTVNQTDSTFQSDIVKASEGELNDPQQLLIDSDKANISLQMAISVRNKALDAYNSIINMQA